MKKIQKNSAIWDLHIHTCSCPKGSNEFSKYKPDEFVKKIISVFKKYKDLELFSFTDHNQISIDVYKEYLQQNGNVEFIVGVEQDIYFEKEAKKQIKHLIIYFDIDNENFEDYEEFMNSYNRHVNLQEMEISDLLQFLVEKKIRFVLSPHAFKQGKRAINHSWNDEESVENQAHKYTDQFFCFWEAQGYSDITRAIEFLKQFDLNDKISIVSFSDSNNFDKLNKYLSNPPQWFLSLPNFKGLQLLSTEKSRITNDKYVVSEKNFGNLIGMIKFNDKQIELSNKLNCIIGGRGSGKSLLLDAIAINLKDIDLRDERKNYLKKFNVEVYNFSGDLIEKNNFVFDYFKQSYVSELFDSNDYYEKIKDRFKEELNQIDEIDVEKLKKDNKEKFYSHIEKQRSNSELDNISDFIGKFSVMSDQMFTCGLLKKDRSKTKQFEYNNIKKVYESLIKKIPEEIKNDVFIKGEIDNLFSLLYKKIYEYNVNLIDEYMIKDMMIDRYFKYRKDFSESSKQKEEIEDLIKDTFLAKGYPHTKRVDIINSYISVQKDFKSKYVNDGFFDGENKNAFLIEKVLKIESPFEYLENKFKDYFYVEKVKDGNSFSIKKAIDYYCFGREHDLKNGKKIEDLDNELLQFDLNYNYYPEISYYQEGAYENIVNLSPGTQTNILMEYLVYKKTDKPLLIDQPEDNVDNQTIYNKLTSWFSELKYQRQVIVVTHDANIAINADAENIIIATHEKKDTFSYMYGALESESNIDIASEILDGGKEAVKRRLMKYGE